MRFRDRIASCRAADAAPIQAMVMTALRVQRSSGVIGVDHR
jgi:hypothetical protein